MQLKTFISGREGIHNIIHVVILILSVFLVVSISVDTFANVPFYRQRNFMSVQLWICIVFLCAYLVELLMSSSKRRYFRRHIVFLIVSIPYQSIIDAFGIGLPAEIAYLIRFMPLIRGGYALAIVVGWFTSNKAVSLLVTYLLSLISSVYFGAMVFYVCEHNINPRVENFGDALWWASMNTTTVGTDISSITPVGRILAVALACLGMMMLPMFTVYLSSIIKSGPKALFVKERVGDDASAPKSASSLKS